jgi:hypothetical protein
LNAVAAVFKVSNEVEEGIAHVSGELGFNAGGEGQGKWRCVSVVVLSRVEPNDALTHAWESFLWYLAW